MTLDIALLAARLESAVYAAGGERAGASTFADLLARYRESHRCYHTLEHIDACLVWLDWYRGVAESSAQIELAIWYHDAVYDPSAHDNESRSAQLCRAQLFALGVGETTIDRVARHIQATQRHAATSGDSRLVVDLDLTILGAVPHAFDRFEAQIRAKYAHIPDALFAAGRSAVLQRFLAKPALFQTAAIREQLEQSARDNLERRIAELANTLADTHPGPT